MDAFSSRVTSYCNQLADALRHLKNLAPEISAVAMRMQGCLANGHKVLLCGNGGSAADAQHMAAELVGRYKKDRPALPAIALSADMMTLTAVANDMGYEQVFRRQVAALGAAGDVLVAISTSGNSQNILLAAKEARAKNMTVIGMTGSKPSPLASCCDICLQVPSAETNHIQELHIAIIHMICEFLEDQQI